MASLSGSTLVSPGAASAAGTSHAAGAPHPPAARKHSRTSSHSGTHRRLSTHVAHRTTSSAGTRRGSEGEGGRRALAAGLTMHALDGPKVSRKKSVADRPIAKSSRSDTNLPRLSRSHSRTSNTSLTSAGGSRSRRPRGGQQRHRSDETVEVVSRDGGAGDEAGDGAGDRAGAEADESWESGGEEDERQPGAARPDEDEHDGGLQLGVRREISDPARKTAAAQSDSEPADAPAAAVAAAAADDGTAHDGHRTTGFGGAAQVPDPGVVQAQQAALERDHVAPAFQVRHRASAVSLAASHSERGSALNLAQAAHHAHHAHHGHHARKGSLGSERGKAGGAGGSSSGMLEAAAPPAAAESGASSGSGQKESQVDPTDFAAPPEAGGRPQPDAQQRHNSTDGSGLPNSGRPETSPAFPFPPMIPPTAEHAASNGGPTQQNVAREHYGSRDEAPASRQGQDERAEQVSQHGQTHATSAPVSRNEAPDSRHEHDSRHVSHSKHVPHHRQDRAAPVPAPVDADARHRLVSAPHPPPLRSRASHSSLRSMQSLRAPPHPLNSPSGARAAMSSAFASPTHGDRERDRRRVPSLHYPPVAPAVVYRETAAGHGWDGEDEDGGPSPLPSTPTKPTAGGGGGGGAHRDGPRDARSGSFSSVRGLRDILGTHAPVPAAPPSPGGSLRPSVHRRKTALEVAAAAARLGSTTDPVAYHQSLGFSPAVAETAHLLSRFLPPRRARGPAWSISYADAPDGPPRVGLVDNQYRAAHESLVRTMRELGTGRGGSRRSNAHHRLADPAAAVVVNGGRAVRRGDWAGKTPFELSVERCIAQRPRLAGM